MKHFGRKAFPPVSKDINHLPRCHKSELSHSLHLLYRKLRHDSVSAVVLTGATEVVSAAFRFNNNFDLLVLIWLDFVVQ